MFYEIVRALIQKIFQDKILAGLVIVGILAVFVGGFGGSVSDRTASGPRDARKAVQSRSAAQVDKTPQSQAHSPESPSSQGPANLDPALAAQFVSWWIGDAMDFNPQTVIQKRQQAMAWITPEVAPAYQSAFFPPELANGICNGSIRGSFTPSSVQPVASNPDGSIVVNVTGNLTLQQGPTPALQQLSTDYLVKRESGGLRIAGLYNRCIAMPNTSPY